MAINKIREVDTIMSQKLITLERKDLPLTVQYGETTYILVVTKSEKLLLQKPLE